MADNAEDFAQQWKKLSDDILTRTRLVEEITGEKMPIEKKLPLGWIVGYLIVNFTILIMIASSSGKDAWMTFFIGLLISIPVAAIAYYISIQQHHWNKLNKMGTLEELQQKAMKKAYGAKDWATTDQINAALGNSASGLHVGSKLYWNGQGHMMTVGGSRGGKGVNLILPALLADNLKETNASSFVILDPKGENLAVSGAYLKSAGYNVLAVNPFDIAEIIQFGNARFNPFDLFSGTDPDFDKYADMIAYALIPPATHSNDYFDKSARNYVTL